MTGAEVKQRMVNGSKGEKKKAVKEEKSQKYWEPLTDGVKWIEKYGEGLESFFERLPDFISTFIATLAIFTFGATLRGMSLCFYILSTTVITLITIRLRFIGDLSNKLWQQNKIVMCIHQLV